MTNKSVKTSTFSEPSALGKFYLIAYNTIQTFGWAYLLFQSLIFFLNRGTLDNFWPEIKWTVIIFQNAAVLEQCHAEESSVMLSGSWDYLQQYLTEVLGEIGKGS